jgi:HSP20 family protein
MSNKEVKAMAIVPYDPFRQLANMRRDFDRIFSDFPISFDHDQHLGNIRVDVHETANEVVATCDIPGLEKKEDVNIDIENNVLQISGMINRTNEVKEENMHRRERYFGRFHRSISLPAPVSHEGVTASYKNGVLEVRIPKLMKDTKKKIDVQFH